MKILTEDYSTWIISTGLINSQNYTDYENTDGRQWRVYGKCNCCGLCETSIDSSYTSIRYNPSTSGLESYTRYVEWTDIPGVSGACREINYQNRKDIPLTPDGISQYSGLCALSGEWLNGN